MSRIFNRRKTTLLRLAQSYCLTTLLIGCLVLLPLISLSPRVGAAEQPPIVIGWTGPLTGASAVVGVDSLRAVEMAVDEVNEAGGVQGRKLVVVAEDDRYEVSQTLTAYKKLASVSKAPVVFMNTYGGVFAAAEQAQRDKVIVLDPLDCNEAIAALPDSVLCLATRTESIGDAFFEHIKARGGSRVFMLVEEEPFMTFVADHLQKRLAEVTGSTVLREQVEPAVNDFKSVAFRAKKFNPDSVIILGNDQMGGALPTIRALGVSAPFYGVGTFLSPGFTKLAGDAVEGAFVSVWNPADSEGVRIFKEDFKKRYGRLPLLDLATLPSYEGARVVIRALPLALDEQGNIDIAKLRQAIVSLPPYEGVVGNVAFDADGAVRTIHEQLHQLRQGVLHSLTKG